MKTGRQCVARRSEPTYPLGADAWSQAIRESGAKKLESASHGVHSSSRAPGEQRSGPAARGRSYPQRIPTGPIRYPGRRRRILLSSSQAKKGGGGVPLEPSLPTGSGAFEAPGASYSVPKSKTLRIEGSSIGGTGARDRIVGETIKRPRFNRRSTQSLARRRILSSSSLPGSKTPVLKSQATPSSRLQKAG